MLHLQQVESRRGHFRHVGLFDLLVADLVQPLPPFGEKPRPGFLGFAHEDHIGIVAEIIFLNGDPGPADHAESSRNP